MSDSENLRFNVYVDGMVTGEFDSKTQDEIAQLLGVSPRTIYEWKKKADWPAIKDARRKLYSHQILKIDAAMIKAAEGGDVNAAKVCYERFDGWVPTTANINRNSTDAELKEQAERIKAEMLGGKVEPGTGSNLPGTSPAAA